MSSPYPVLDDKPIDQWRVTELREELKRRELSTKGLKEDLVKRLNNALVSEPDTNEDGNNGSDVFQKTDIQFEEDEKRSEIIDDVVASQPEAVSEEGKSGSLVSRTAEAGMESANNGNQIGSDNLTKSDIQFEEDEKRSEIIDDVVASQPEAVSEEGKSGLLVSRTAEAGMESGTNIQMGYSNSRNEDEAKIGVVDGKDAKENGVGYHSKEDKHPAETLNHELPVVKEDIAVVVSVSQPDLDQDKSELDKPQSLHADDGDSISAHHTSSTVPSDLDNQAPEISLAVGVQVKSGFPSAESGSINEKNEAKDNVIADVTLAVDVEPEMMELSSSNTLLNCTESDHADVHEEKDGDTANIVDCIKKEESGDTGSPEKLNLDHSSGDDSMEEDVPEIKHNSGSDVLGPKVETVEPSLGRADSNIVDAADMSLDTELVEMEYEKSSNAVPLKRKLDGQSTAENNDATKRQRRIQQDAFKLPREQSVNTVAFTKRKDSLHPTVKGGSSKLESADSEAPKERVVPPSAKPPTTSLRIDRFLRPFTLKAVQDLLGRTGTVVSFWMDHIKTHCFVTYSTVEEAIETRNAVYNLQWPANGGHLLIADFVDPQEVKLRVEGPLQSPMTPTTPAGMRQSLPSAQPKGPPQPLPRQQVQLQQVQLQQLPPPPPRLAKPLAAREKVLQANKQLPPVKEQLVPPPQILEKVDPPALTLDDLFRKTIASPRIYYLPLSDEQVAAKLEAQGYNIKH